MNYNDYKEKKFPIVELDDEGLRKYQLEVLKIALDFVKFCDYNNIKYSLSGGSVLGAIRHKGFIPWDDDIDINMPRKDYDRFVSLFQREFKDKYLLQTPKNSPELGLLVTQIRKKGTVARRKYDWNAEECGISIDIYVIENVFTSPVLFYIQKAGSLIFPFAVSASRTFNNRRLPKQIEKLESRRVRYKNSKLIIGWLFHLIPLRVWISLSLKFFTLCKNNSSNLVSIPSGRKHFNGELYSRDELCKMVNHKFENIEFKIPIGYDQYLKQLYGNYMLIPSVEKREKHVFLELKY
ncbi:LicD family protein [Clostridium lundense]|uniref:LicD family protein n=1 Tax=Clostridium lundense TaxID=319475 RepID=UPI0006861228|nr:LicD family protein [Clostridium lundense]